MPSVEELLNQDSEDETNLEAYADTGIEYCTVDDDTRLVTIPDKYKKLGVESDEKVKRIWFRFPKFVGNNGIDLSAIGVRVNYRNANGDGDIYIVEDLTTDGDYVTFSWELTRKVTAYKGNVSFVVCAVKSATDGTIKNEWNTTLNKECEVLEGLEVTEQIAQENPDIIEYILANLGGSVSAEDIANAVEEYMTAHPFTETDPTVSDWAKQPKKPTYTALEVGADAAGTAENKVSEHNASDTAHEDIRRLINGIEVPEKLPNPYPLIFTGGASGSYNGSEAITITIPQGDGSRISITEETLEGHYLDLWERSVSGLFILKSGDGNDIIVRAAKNDRSTELGYVITEVATLSPQILCSMNYVEIKSVVTENITVTIHNMYFYDAMTGVYVHQFNTKKGSKPQGFDTKEPITDGSIFIQSPDSAEVGQVLEVETVDKNGKPTSWKTVTIQFPESSGGTVRIEKLSTDTAVELEPNKLYIFPEMSELTITLAEPSDTSIVSEYHFVFQSGATATTLTIPDTIKLPSNFSVDASKIYEISILEGCLCAQSWAVTA